jgi:hypothetical protein
MELNTMTKEDLVSLFKEAMSEYAEAHPLSSEEVQWVRMAIKAEADRAALRKAIIEKSLAGLVWAALLTGGGWAIDYIASHWK